MNYTNPTERMHYFKDHIRSKVNYLIERVEKLANLRIDLYNNHRESEILEKSEDLHKTVIGQINSIRSDLDSLEKAVISCQEDDFNYNKAAVLWYVRQVKRGPTIEEITDHYDSNHWGFYSLKSDGIKIAIVDLLNEKKIMFIEDGRIKEYYNPTVTGVPNE